VFVWVVALSVEVVSSGKRWSSHLVEPWHLLDLASLLLFYLGFITRWYALTPAKVLYCLAGILFFIRLLHVFALHPRLGPLLATLGRMFGDVASFFLLFFVVVIAFGVAFRGILAQDDPDSEASRDALWRVYWNLYGKLFIHDVESESPVVVVMFAVYLVIAVILLLTLLIAMLTSTYEAVRAESNTVWMTQYHAVVAEANATSVSVPAPLSLPIRLFSWMSRVPAALVRLCSLGKPSPRSAIIQRRAKTLFHHLDVFQLGVLQRVQMQQIVDGMSKIPLKAHGSNLVSVFVECMNLSEAPSVSREEFVEGLLEWLRAVPDDPDTLLDIIYEALRRSETRWERDERQRVSEFEGVMRRRGLASGALLGSDEQ